jgi:hypothetical protein
MPSCNITIYDNESTDSSVEIAKALGCTVVSWSSGNINNELEKINIRNTCWKKITNGWIIMADMDEWICITEEELDKEQKTGTSILRIKGLNMIGESATLDLSDINLHAIKTYRENDHESKNICFLRDKISSMNFGTGSHVCNPIGAVHYSSRIYVNKHMAVLGLKFLINKMIQRYGRSAFNRSKGMSTHYINDIAKITENYNHQLQHSKTLNNDQIFTYDTQWKEYIGRYPDLTKAGINTREKALKHWNTYGKKERRIW